MKEEKKIEAPSSSKTLTIKKTYLLDTVRQEKGKEPSAHQPLCANRQNVISLLDDESALANYVQNNKRVKGGHLPRSLASQ